MIIRNALSLTVHRMIIHTDCSLDEFALRTKNCWLTGESDWRCTYYGDDFSTNLFNAKKIPTKALVSMAFSKGKKLEDYERDFKKLFGPDIIIEDFTLVNWVEKFYTTHKTVSLNKLEGLLVEDDETIFIKKVKQRGRKTRPKKIASYDIKVYDSDSDSEKEPKRIKIGDDDGSAPSVSMDQQKFSALIIRPFPKESNFAIEVFSTGNLNVAGIPSEEYFKKRVVPYIKDKLMGFMEKCDIGVSQNEIDDLKDEFIF